MKLYSILWASAAKLASSQTVRRVELIGEIARRQAHPITDEVAREIAAMEAEAENCRQALHRLTAFRPDKDPTCPYCWIVGGMEYPVRWGDPPDTCQCTNCGAEYQMGAP